MKVKGQRSWYYGAASYHYQDYWGRYVGREIAILTAVAFTLPWKSSEAIWLAFVPTWPVVASPRRLWSVHVAVCTCTGPVRLLTSGYNQRKEGPGGVWDQLASSGVSPVPIPSFHTALIALPLSFPSPYFSPFIPPPPPLSPSFLSPPQLGAGTAVPGVMAAKCGAQVTLSDREGERSTHLLENLRRACAINGLSDVKLEAISWGIFSPTVLQMEPPDVILASDCFYDSKGTATTPPLLNMGRYYSTIMCHYWDITVK